MVTSRVGIASQFLQNAYTNGEQAARSLDEIARNALFATYFGGNTRVRVTLGSAGSAVAVDDIRGFQTVFISGIQTAVANSPGLTVTIGANAYTLVAAVADIINLSTAPGGVSGVLTFSASVSVSDGTAGNAVQAANASVIIRPNARTSSAGLVATDTLAMANLLDAVAKLRMNAVPDIDGVFNCYLDPVSARQLFADQDFQRLFQGATSANQVFKMGMINDFLGLRFIPTTEAYVQPHPTLPNVVIRRPIICGKVPSSKVISPAWPRRTWRPGTASSLWWMALPWSPASRSIVCNRLSRSPGTGLAVFVLPATPRPTPPSFQLPPTPPTSAPS